MGAKVEPHCRFCDHVIRPDEALGTDGSAHAACIEAHRDDAASSGALGPIKRFMKVWWGSGHH
jgi:hypothetical protein